MDGAASDSNSSSLLVNDEESFKRVPCDWLFPQPQIIQEQHRNVLLQQMEKILEMEEIAKETEEKEPVLPAPLLVSSALRRKSESSMMPVPLAIVNLIIEFEYGTHQRARRLLYDSHCHRNAHRVFDEYFRRRFYMHYLFRNLAGFGFISSLLWFVITETRVPLSSVTANTNSSTKPSVPSSLSDLLPRSRYLLGYVTAAGVFEIIRNAWFARTKSEFMHFDSHFFDHTIRHSKERDDKPEEKEENEECEDGNDERTLSMNADIILDLRQKWKRLCFRYPHTHKPKMKIRERGNGWRVYGPIEDDDESIISNYNSTLNSLYECNLSLLYASLIELAPRNADSRSVMNPSLARLVSDLPTLVPLYTMFSSLSQMVSAMLSASMMNAGAVRGRRMNRTPSEILNSDAHRISLKWCFIVVVSSMQTATLHRDYFPHSMRKMAALLSGLWSVISAGLAYIDARESSERQSMNIDWLAVSAVSAERKRMFPFRMTHALPWILSSATFTYCTIRDVWSMEDDSSTKNNQQSSTMMGVSNNIIPRVFHGFLMVSTLLNIGNYTYLDSGYAYEDLKLGGNALARRSDIEIIAKEKADELNAPRDVFEWCSLFSCRVESAVIYGCLMLSSHDPMIIGHGNGGLALTV